MITLIHKRLGDSAFPRSGSDSPTFSEVYPFTKHNLHIDIKFPKGSFKFQFTTNKHQPGDQITGVKVPFYATLEELYHGGEKKVEYQRKK